jgi:hypothetical protein
VPREPAAVEHGVDLELGGAEHELDPLAELGVRNAVAAALEAEQPVTRDNAGGAVDDEVGGRRQAHQRGAVTLGPDGDDLAMGAMLPFAGDPLVPRQPLDVRLLGARSRGQPASDT